MRGPLIAGLVWRTQLLKQHGDVLNGTLTVGVGVAIALIVVCLNFQRYRFAHGVVATLIQAVALPFAVLFGAVYLLWHFYTNMLDPVHRVRVEKD